METYKSLLKVCLLGVSLSLVPMESSASTIASVEVNSSSGIENADLTATYSDGTVLGFRRSGSTVYFCGAISERAELALPDSIVYSSGRYAVTNIGYSRCDFDKARSVSSLTLPMTMNDINYLPPLVKVLHVNNYIRSINYNELSGLDKVLVPAGDLDSYYNDEKWRNYVLINVEGTEPLKITVNMTKAGEFAQLLLQQTDNWYKVNELVVAGELNTDDMDVFKRMKQLTRLDLERALITDIPNNFDGENTWSRTRNGFNLLEELILPEVNSIGDYAFANCYRLKNITLPKVNSIGAAAFANVAASYIALPEGVTTIKNHAFYGGRLESITIPSSITEISDCCFRDCSLLKTAEVPATVTKIGYEAFRESGLTSISLPGVQTIDSYAFGDCYELAEVNFAEGLSNLQYQPFRNCTALSEIDLPSSLQSVDQAFYNCSNIKKVISRAVVPPAHNSSSFLLNGCDMTDVKLYVPAMSIDEYRLEQGWKSFYTILPLEDKTSDLYIYDYATIEDASEFTDGCNMTIDWLNQNRNGSTKNYYGALDFNGSTVLSMHNYKQIHDLGRGTSGNPYTHNGTFTSLVSNGIMRADSVQTTMKAQETYIWYFISLPYDVKVSEIEYTDGTQFVIRKYSGYNRSQLKAETWIDLTADDTMKAYEGYILRCNKEDAIFTFPAINNGSKNKVFEMESVEMPLEEYLSEFEHNRSWNLIGNPYPCYYDTRMMDFTAPITVYNRHDNRYDAYSPIDDEYILHPAQAFFVQRPVDRGTITFDKDGRQKDALVQQRQTDVRRCSAVNTDRMIFNIVMRDGKAEDRTRVVMNSAASLSYELDKDASKFIAGDNAGMLVYTVENGVRYAINERPMDNGIVKLGFYSASAGDYTLSINTEEFEDVVLIDNETNTETALENGYSFSAESGYNDNRFTLKFSDISGIEAVSVENGISTEPYSVYTMDGRLVGNYTAGVKADLAKGIYIISSKATTRKIIVK